jgi:hypothetical protein
MKGAARGKRGTVRRNAGKDVALYCAAWRTCDCKARAEINPPGDVRSASEERQLRAELRRLRFIGLACAGACEMTLSGSASLRVGHVYAFRIDIRWRRDMKVLLVIDAQVSQRI